MGRKFVVLKDPTGQVAKRTEIELQDETIQKGGPGSGRHPEHGQFDSPAGTTPTTNKPALHTSPKGSSVTHYAKSPTSEAHVVEWKDKDTKNPSVTHFNSNTEARQHMSARFGIGNKSEKGDITHTEAYERVKDQPRVEDPHALAQHIVEQTGGEPKKKDAASSAVKNSDYKKYSDQLANIRKGGPGSGRHPEGGAKKENDFTHIVTGPREHTFHPSKEEAKRRIKELGSSKDFTIKPFPKEKVDTEKEVS